MICVRRMEEEDLAAVCEIEKSCFSQPWSYQDFAEVLKNERAVYLVAQKEEAVVGHCGMLTVLDEGQIVNVAVAKACRGERIARRMLQALMKLGEEIGVSAYTLEVRAGNDAAIHVYEKLGFKREGLRKNFYEKPREDALIMWKR